MRRLVHGIITAIRSAIGVGLLIVIFITQTPFAPTAWRVRLASETKALDAHLASLMGRHLRVAPVIPGRCVVQPAAVAVTAH